MLWYFFQTQGPIHGWIHNLFAPLMNYQYLLLVVLITHGWHSSKTCHFHVAMSCKSYLFKCWTLVISSTHKYGATYNCLFYWDHFPSISFLDDAETLFIRLSLKVRAEPRPGKNSLRRLPYAGNILSLG